MVPAVVAMTATTAHASGAGRPGAADSIGIMASSSCIVGSSGTCRTAIVPANALGHYVDVVVNNRLRPSPCNYEVIDTITNQVVNWNVVPSNTRLSLRLPNVYSQYQLKLYWCLASATGILDND
ncbi:hypothetical protein Ade02nite_82500 [Paractinoplanes deccanensis]|uniref:Uncharacterized protein n=1 Tax=Paractinoplanes deccanensis TaxID=113561 RepID=A0ABQ3YI12_9ACTN|nr:hypothetical protein Ade02nite_82500 [Actinoplanes deccanensis]